MKSSIFGFSLPYFLVLRYFDKAQYKPFDRLRTGKLSGIKN